MKDRIHDFNPNDGLLRIPNYCLKDLIDKGYAYCPLPNGDVVRITKDDILIKEEDLLKLAEFLKGKDNKFDHVTLEG